MLVADKAIVLKLNKLWQPMHFMRVSKAFVDIASPVTANLALDIEYDVDIDGKPLLDQPPIWMNPVTWDEWIQLPVREYDLSINTPKCKIRVPTVIIAPNYAKMPMRRQRFTTDNIRKRDGSKCQYTGKILTRAQGTVDHIIPKSRGGKDRDWRNVVWCEKSLNHKKGNRLNDEIGLKLLKEPKEPKSLPASAFFHKENARHHDWIHFLSH